MTSLTYAAGVKALAAGTLDFLADPIEILLVQSKYTPSRDDTSAVYAVAELPDLGDYVGGFGGAGRKVLQSKTATPDAAMQRVVVQAANPSPWQLGHGDELGGAIVGKRGSGSDATAVPLFFVDTVDVDTNGLTFTLKLGAISISFTSSVVEPPPEVVEPPLESVEPPPEPTEPPPEPSVGTNALRGAITADGAPTGGGTIQVFDGTTLVATVAVAADGTYALTNLTAGPRVVQFSPNYKKSHLSHPDGRQSVTIGATAAVADYTVQSAIGYCDGGNLATDAGCRSTTIPPVADSWWRNFSDASPDFIDSPMMNGVIRVVPAEDGSPCMEYHYDPRPTCPNGPTSCPNSISTAARIALESGLKDLWFVWRNWLSPNFTMGGGGAQGSQAELKFLILDFLGKQVEVMLDNPHAGGPDTDICVRLIVSGVEVVRTDGLGPIYDYHPAPGSLVNVWDSWALHLSGFDTTSMTTTLYHRGVARLSLTGNFLGGSYPSLATLSCGTQINNGPDNAQDRRWKRFAFYRSQPSLLNTLAL